MKMNKRILLAIIIAAVIAGFSAQRCTEWTSSIDASRDAQGQQRSVGRLNHQQTVVSYLHQHQRLPDYYITKKQAREQGWEPRDGNLCLVLPGARRLAAIGSLTVRGNCLAPTTGYGVRRTSIISAADVVPIACCIPTTV